MRKRMNRKENRVNMWRKVTLKGETEMDYV